MKMTYAGIVRRFVSKAGYMVSMSLSIPPKLNSPLTSESSSLEIQRDVLLHRDGRQPPRQSKKIDRPQVVIAERRPEIGQRKTLTIVHVALAGIVSQDSIDHDLLFALCKPSILPSEPACGLSRRRWEVKVGDDADEAGECSLEGEEPSLLTISTAIGVS